MFGSLVGNKRHEEDDWVLVEQPRNSVASQKIFRPEEEKAWRQSFKEHGYCIIRGVFSAGSVFCV